MDPAVRAVFGVLLRWVHIASVVTLIGGFIYARFALAPALASLPPSERELAGGVAVSSFRPLMFFVLIAAIGSGMYNYANKASFPPGYQMWFGIKILFVLHIAVAAILYSLRPSSQEKRNRTALGIAISGVIVIAISAYLRYLSLR
jgi:uncharacterized membrane protein